ncbi:MAG: GNAT family N-acetyltransferase [Haloferacaceae archaeon]
MKIRPLDGRDDARGLLRAHALSWREAYDGLVSAELLEAQDPDPTESDVDGMLEALPDRGVVLVAVEEATVRGFADFRWGSEETKAFVGPGEAGLRAIYVRPDDWGRGIGTALVDRGVGHLPDSTEAVRLEVLSGNERARRFYESAGFRPAGSTTHELGGTEYPTTIYERIL